MPTTTGSVEETGALAKMEHIQKKLRVVEGGVNGGVAAKIGCGALGKWIHGVGRYQISVIRYQIRRRTKVTQRRRVRGGREKRRGEV